MNVKAKAHRRKAQALPRQAKRMAMSITSGIGHRKGGKY